jgi:hypothetical protein
MKLYDFLESENIETEYKEFFFKLNFEKYFNESQIYQFLFNEKIKSFDDESFNSYLIDNFQIYFENYLSKFIASIQNNIDITNPSSIFFGVNDNGYITGIPYINIDENFVNKINKKLKKVLYKNLRIYDNFSFIELFDEWFNNNIEINFVNIDISNFIFTNKYKTYLNKWINEKKQYKNKINELKKQQIDFLQEHRLYTQKLENIIKDAVVIPKLIQFIEKMSSKENPLIKKILNKEEFDIYGDNLYDKINDSNHILYYLTKFKDEQINEVKKKRPLTMYVPNVIPLDFIFHNIQNMIELWIKKGFRFCYLEIKYKNNDKKNIFSLFYKMKWRYSLRIIKSIDDPGTHIMNFDLYERTKDLINWRKIKTQEELNFIVSKILCLEKFT